MENFHKACLVNEIAANSSKVVEINGEEIAIFNLNGNFYALTNTCPHRGGPLGEGAIEGETVTCPWHGWNFCIKDGKNPNMPQISAKSIPLKVEGDSILVSV